MSPGPCTTQVGVGTGDAVDVGEGVFVNIAGAVLVGESGLAVRVGLATTLCVAGVAMQEDNKNRTPATIFIFLIDIIDCLEGMVEIPKNAQAVQSKPGSNNLDDIGFLGNDFGKTACGDDLHLRT